MIQTPHCLIRPFACTLSLMVCWSNPIFFADHTVELILNVTFPFGKCEIIRICTLVRSAQVNVARFWSCQTTEISLHQNIDPYNSVEPETTTNLKRIPLIGNVTMSAEALEASYWLKTKRVIADILITAIYSLFPIWQEKWAVIQDRWTVSGWWVDLSKPQPQLWSTPESPIGFHLIHPIWFAHTTEKWEIVRGEKMNGICINTPSTLLSPFFSSYTAIPQSCDCNTVTVPRCTTSFLFLSLRLYLSPPFLPLRALLLLRLSVSARLWVSDGVLVDPVSSPVVFQCHTSEAEH